MRVSIAACICAHFCGVISLPFVPAGVQNSVEGPFQCNHVLDVGAGRVVPQAFGGEKVVCGAVSTP